MSHWLIALVGVIYALTGLKLLWEGQGAFGLMWISYSVANFALLKAGAGGL